MIMIMTISICLSGLAFFHLLTHAMFKALLLLLLLLLHCVLNMYKENYFGGLEVACWPLVPKFTGSNPAEAVGFLRAKNSSARLPSERK
jgi:formate hydrogenlyase subunit 3/multisubunit Na+/H+ antiporter MnhD subunit